MTERKYWRIPKSDQYDFSQLVQGAGFEVGEELVTERGIDGDYHPIKSKPMIDDGNIDGFIGRSFEDLTHVVYFPDQPEQFSEALRFRDLLDANNIPYIEDPSRDSVLSSLAERIVKVTGEERILHEKKARILDLKARVAEVRR